MSHKSEKTFKDFALSERVHTALEKAELQIATEIQAASIPSALEGRDILGCAATGSGKTIAFALPLVEYLAKNPEQKALVLVPTRELAFQVGQVVMTYAGVLGIKGAVIVGGQPYPMQLRKLSQNPRFIIATPGRLLDHHRKGILSFERYSFFVLDEVDRMLDLGFGPQIRDVAKMLPEDRQTLLFSATLPHEIKRDADALLKNPLFVKVSEEVNQPSADVHEQDIFVAPETKKSILLEQIQKRRGKIIVFTNTQRRSEQLGQYLEERNVDISVLHGGMRLSERRRAFVEFATGGNRILVATDLASRGIDVKGVEHVINFDLPPCKEDYIHRIGRTGRMGATGEAVNLVLPNETGPSMWFDPKDSGTGSAWNQPKPLRRKVRKNGSKGRSRR